MMVNRICNTMLSPMNCSERLASVCASQAQSRHGARSVLMMMSMAEEDLLSSF